MRYIPHITKGLIATITIILLLIGALVVFPRVLAQKDFGDYVHGRYGKYCYSIKNYPKNIKYFVYFDSEEECWADLNK